MRLPPLPRAIWTPQGRITVVRPRGKLMHEGEECYGLWDPGERRVSVAPRIRRDVAWLVLFHELAHQALTDFNVDVPDGPAGKQPPVEQVCDSFAAWQFARFQRLVEHHGPDAALIAVGCDG